MTDTVQPLIAYPGSFDPFTVGHLDILRRACALFPRLVVLAAADGKAGLLPAERRVELIRRAVTDLENVETRVFHGLLVDEVRRCGASAVVRGIRCAGDYEHEWGMAGVNALLDHQVEFIYLLARPDLAAVSSTLVRDVIRHGGALEKLVPPVIAAALRREFSSD